MNRLIKSYSPDEPEDAARVASVNDESLADERPLDAVRDEDGSNSAEHLTNARLDTKSDGGDQANVRGGDSTVLGAGGTAGGLSGNGDQTDE